MIKVLHYIGSLHYAGAQTFLMELYRNINRENIEFDFVVSPEEQDGFYNEIMQQDRRIFCCPRYKIINHYNFVNWWRRFWFKHHHEYDIFHVHVTATAAIAIKEAKRYGVKIVMHSHSNSNGEGVMACVKDYMQRDLNKLSDYMFGCSDAAGKYLFGDSVIHNKRYQTLPNAIDINRFCFSEENRRIIRTKLGITNKYVIGIVGRFHPLKNHIFAINLMPKVLKECPNSVLLLIGEGRERKNIEDRINQLGIRDKVLMLGNQIHPEYYYAAMDLFLLPSLYEGFGIVGLEAQTSGLTCIVSTSVPRSLNVTGNVIFIELNSEKWVKKIKQYYLSERTSCCDIEKVKKAGYDARELAEKVEDIYESICKGGENN